jgi:hypothetical protein
MLALALACAMVLPAAAFAGGEMSQQAIMEELQALKAKLAETDQLKAKIRELEARLAKQEESTKEAEALAVEAVKTSEGFADKLADATKFKVGGALRFNYRNTDFNETQKSRGGDGVFDIFRIDVNGEYNDVLLSLQYRWYSYMDVIHHGWFGYNFTDNFQGQMGITQVPFGNLPYASHNWWFSLAYYVGLEDDYDLGVKGIYDYGPLNVQAAFFKNGEWGNPGKWDRYSYDVVTGNGFNDEETNQVNLRVAYTLAHAEKYTTEFGVSGEWGQLYNSVTDEAGSHWAAAAHLNGNYGPFNVMLEAARYKYDPDRADGAPNDNLVQMGAFFDAFNVASEANVYVAGVAYNIPVNFGPVTGLQFYNDYSHIVKDEDGFEDSQLNTLGMLISANPLYIYVDWVYGKNVLYVGGPRDSFGAGASDADWHSLFNINFGYYF